jgi:hypothetical protein
MTDAMPTPNPTPTQGPTPTTRFRDAYQHYLAEIKQVPDDDLIAINIDIPTAVTTTFGALPEINALRPQIASDIPSFNLARFDNLEGYTLALGYAHTLWLAASTPAQPIEELSKTASATRELLASDAAALAQRGLLDGQRLRDLKGPVGYRNLAFDLFTLAALLRENWDKVSGKTAVQPAELDAAEALGDRLLTAVGSREQGPAVVAENAAIRQRAFTLFIETYDDARRAVQYLRWHHEDADMVAPSLYAGRGGRRKATQEPASNSAPKPVAGADGGEAPPVHGTATDQDAPHASGLPGASPYAAS